LTSTAAKERKARNISVVLRARCVQTPAATMVHQRAGVKTCRYARRRNVRTASSAKGWRRLAGAYPTESTGKTHDAGSRRVMDSQHGGKDSAEFAGCFLDAIRMVLRMAVLYSFAAAAGRLAFLRKYKNELLALPRVNAGVLEGQERRTFRFDPTMSTRKSRWREAPTFAVPRHSVIWNRDDTTLSFNPTSKRIRNDGALLTQRSREARRAAKQISTGSFERPLAYFGAASRRQGRTLAAAEWESAQRCRSARTRRRPRARLAPRRVSSFRCEVPEEAVEIAKQELAAGQRQIRKRSRLCNRLQDY